MDKTEKLQRLDEVTPPQLALALFDELFPIGTPIAGSPSEIGFRRHRILVDIVELGLASRRALDAAFFIVAQEPEIRNEYDIDLSYFKWLMTYTSNNRKHLRSVLRDLQKAALEGDSGADSEQWGAIPLMGPVAINGGRLVFELDKRLQKLLKDPQQAPFLSLRISNVFTSNYARVLYDHLLNHKDVRTTGWLPLETVRIWTDANSKAFQEFKQFRRTVLDPSIKQINELSNLTAGYETKNIPGSKKIGFLRFQIEEKLENPLQSSKLSLKELYETLRGEFGLSPKNMDEITQNRDNWTDEWVHQAIEFTRFNIERGNVKRSVPGFLMHALRNNLRVGTAEIEVAAQLTAPKSTGRSNSNIKKLDPSETIRTQQDAQVNDEVSATVTAGWAVFDVLDEETRRGFMDEFRKTQVAKISARKERVDIGDMTEDVLRSNGLLLQAFGQFMHGKRPLRTS